MSASVRVVSDSFQILERRPPLALRRGDRDLAHRTRDRRRVVRRARVERRAEHRAAHRQGVQRRVGGVTHDPFIAIDDDAERLVGPGLLHPGSAALPVELVFDAPRREADRRIFSGVGGGLEPHAPGAALLDHHHVVGVRRKRDAGGDLELREDEAREAARRRQGRAGDGWKLVRGGSRLADLDVEVVVLGVVGVDVHAGEDVAVRVATRVEQLRMVVATGVGVVIVRYRGVAHEDARRGRAPR